MKVKIKSDMWANYNNLGHLGIFVGAVVEVEDIADDYAYSVITVISYGKHVRILKDDCIEINELRSKKIKRVLK